jgi:hypothetical protein
MPQTPMPQTMSKPTPKLMSTPKAVSKSPPPPAAPLNAGRIPLGLKLAFSAFMAVLVPVYWANYGPANFFYFCDLALLITLVGVWREDALLISMPAVGILAPQAIWIADYLGHFVGMPLNGMTDYMFKSSSSLFLRGLSLFHGWLPVMLVYLVYRVGYDRRALKAWTGLAWVVLLICYFVLPGPNPNPGNAAVNVNYVFGMSDTAAQTWMHPRLWLATLMIGAPLVLFAPVHFILAKWKSIR